ncbi:carboxypeptidase regulatory-like domain-containing protein [Cyclobacterium jeungdonense]|uniref:Carboxypeptidase regulatory-like domain-containing protein n=1 Tax=Cyclobacterium jeungdonense TaxID=708087 RepID=A0ABT8C3F3_9BACT|nr:carboxypeptidase regulatory-like domain-containing protein [Cyclobacterium jeungdonense]MDN3686579.1 carboxypeptidase regulatory-like domain-containing protein [Cyclobacterium jeungdonense]
MRPLFHIFLLSLLASFLISACKSSRQVPQSSEKTESQTPEKETTKTLKTPSGEGIKGQVYWIDGNLMPQATDSGNDSRLGPKKQPVKRTIRIHELTHINEASLGDYLFGDIETPLVAELETDESGYFEVKLPPGKYSIFTKEDKGYFANVFDLDSFIHPITVEKNKWKRTEITIDYKASY